MIICIRELHFTIDHVSNYKTYLFKDLVIVSIQTYEKNGIFFNTKNKKKIK